MLDRLETLGVVERARSEQDRRVVLTRISEKAQALIATLDEPLAALHTRQFGHLPPDRLRALLDLLNEATSKPGVTVPPAVAVQGDFQ